MFLNSTSFKIYRIFKEKIRGHKIRVHNFSEIQEGLMKKISSVDILYRIFFTRLRQFFCGNLRT